MDLFSMFTGTKKIAMIDDIDAREAYEVLARHTIQPPSDGLTNVVSFRLPMSKSTFNCDDVSSAAAPKQFLVRRQVV